MSQPHGKVFGIGLSKTGTTSLCVALDKLGYRAGTYRHLRALGLEDWFRGDFSGDALEDYDALTDLPIGAFFQQLDRRYPGSKFVLTTRDRDAWLASCRVYFTDRSNGDDPFFRRTQLAAYGTVGFSEAHFARTWDAHVDAVRTWFRDRPDDLLVMEIVSGDGWERLCPFLGRPRPDAPFPSVEPGARLASEEKRRSSPARNRDRLTEVREGKLRRRWRMRVRKILGSLGIDDVEPGGRTLGLHRLALEEAGMRPPRHVQRVLPFVARLASSLVEQVQALPGEKVHDFAFLGSVFSDDVIEQRRWVLEFARKHFTDDSLLVVTDAPEDYRPVGPFDRSLEDGWDRFRPKEVPVADRLHVDLGYFASMRASRFTLCPAGDQPWSMRFFEAVLCGSLPIVESHRHTGRNAAERGIGYHYYMLGDACEYRADWVEENLRRLLRAQTYRSPTVAARMRNWVDRSGWT